MEPYFLGGPPLVKAATGEEVSAQDLGGAALHAKTSGVVDYLALNDAHGLQLARTIVSRFDLSPPVGPSEPYKEPAYPCEELFGIIPQDLRQPYDVREVIARLVDDSWFEEFKPLYGPTLVCGFASLYGYTVGIIANNGILFSESSLKGAHFIEICCQQGIPLIFLQNVNGFMVGKKYEAQGIAKDGAKLVHAVACATVPKFTVFIGGSFGAGNYAMCGRAYSPRFLWTWPNSRISVMGGEQAAMVLSQIRQDALKQKGQDLSPEEMLTHQNTIRQQYETQGSPYYATARLWDDGVINPLQTRRVLGLGLSISLNSFKKEGLKFGVFRM